jgi:hypothetical protein
MYCLKRYYRLGVSRGCVIIESSRLGRLYLVGRRFLFLEWRISAIKACSTCCLKGVSMWGVIATLLFLHPATKLPHLTASVIVISE